MDERALLGRYIDRESFVHSLDPRTKLILSLVLMIVILLATSWLSLAWCAIFIGVCYGLSRITPWEGLRSIAPLLFIVIITALLNIFFNNAGTVWWSWGPFTISEGGLYNAVFMSVRLVLLLVSVSLLTLTTTNLDITEAFERLLNPLRAIKLPSHEIAMIMGIALRFLPQFATELRTIYRAQICRGAHFSLWPPAEGTRGLTALLVPLFTSAFRHGDTLSEAMEARCYHGGVGRTRLHPLHLTYRDGVACGITLLVCVGVFVLNFVGIF